MRSLRGEVTSAGFVVAYVAAMLLGRALPIDGETLSVIWPGCGVAALWLLSVRHAFPVVDVGLLAVATFLVNYLTGVSAALSVSFTVVNVVQACLAVALLRRFCPDLWGCGGRGTVDNLRTLFVTVGAGAVSSAVAAGVAAVGFQLAADYPGPDVPRPALGSQHVRLRPRRHHRPPAGPRRPLPGPAPRRARRDPVAWRRARSPCC